MFVAWIAVANLSLLVRNTLGTFFIVRKLYGPWSSGSISLLENAIKPLISTALNKRLENVLFDCMIVSHPRLRFCPGPNCQKVIFSIQTPAAKRVQVKQQFRNICDFRLTLRQWSLVSLASDNKVTQSRFNE